jgi:sugar phosphate isomerase/epimerase
MYKNLGTGHLGVEADQLQAIEYAQRFGFGGVNVHLSELEAMSEAQRQERVQQLTALGLQWGVSGLPVEFRRDDEEFRQGIRRFPRQAELLQQVGATRVSTWILPGDDELTYLANFKRHRDRLAQVAAILQEHGLRLGLEFVGPKTLRDRFRYPFIHTQAEMMELCREIGTGNCGLLLDSWHWHTSHGTIAELERLTAQDIVEVHVNDAPRDLPIDELVDNRRALPCATGVIDLKNLMQFLRKIDYDGPVTCEPFDDELRALENEPALRKTGAALDCVFGMLDA